MSGKGTFVRRRYIALSSEHLIFQTRFEIISVTYIKILSKWSKSLITLALPDYSFII